MLIYCLSAIIIYNLIDRLKEKLYFHPSSYIAETKNKIITISNKYYAITNNNTYRLKSDKPCLVVSHGNAGNITNRDYLLEKLDSNDGDIYCYEYPGFGQCPGNISISNCVDTHIFWLDKLSQKYPRIDLWGESIGGGIVIETLCRLNKKSHSNIINKIGKIYLQSTFSSIYNVVKSINPTLSNFYYLLMFDDLEVEKSLGHEDYISKFKDNEIIILHSKSDELIPFKEAEINYKKCMENKLNVRLIEIKGTHNNIILPKLFFF
jgi:esterase/lipase